RVVVLAVLRADARTVAGARRAYRRRADRLLRVPARDPAPATLGGGADVHRHPPLDGDAARRALRRAGAAGCTGAGGTRLLPAAAPPGLRAESGGRRPGLRLSCNRDDECSPRLVNDRNAGPAWPVADS